VSDIDSLSDRSSGLHIRSKMPLTLGFVAIVAVTVCMLGTSSMNMGGMPMNEGI